MSLDQATVKFLDETVKTNGKPLHKCTPDEARHFGSTIFQMLGPAPEMEHVIEKTIERPNGKIMLRILKPVKIPRGVLVYYHGGGWVTGSIDDYDTIGRKLAERTSCTVVLVQYRLAPEYPYPTAVNDSYAALEWVDEHLTSRTCATVPLIVAGDSAGGNLAAIMAIRARDLNGPNIALQILIYPVTDADFFRPSYVDPENQLLLTRDGMMWFWNHYLPNASRRIEPDASPLRTKDLSRLPSAIVLTAEHDVLRDEGEEYHKRLQQSGVPAELERYSGQIHGFFTLLMLPGSELGFQQVVKAIKACIFAVRNS